MRKSFPLLRGEGKRVESKTPKLAMVIYANSYGESNMCFCIQSLAPSNSCAFMRESVCVFGIFDDYPPSYEWKMMGSRRSWYSLTWALFPLNTPARQKCTHKNIFKASGVGKLALNQNVGTNPSVERNNGIRGEISILAETIFHPFF